MEQKILSACAQDRSRWVSISGLISPEEFSPDGAMIYRLIGEYYEADKTANQVDLDILVGRAEREIASNKASEIVISGIKNLSQSVSGINIVKEATALKAHEIGLKLASRLASGKVSDEINRLMMEYMDITTRGQVLSDDEEVFNNTSAGELSKNYDPGKTIKVLPKVLNDHLDGGIRGGHHILIFAPTEMAKSLLALNMCRGFLWQNLVTGYVGNEDPASDMQMRMMSNLTGFNKYEILADPKRADGVLARRNWDKFIFANLAPGTFPRISRLVEKYGVQVLILDQLRNIDVSSENRTQALERAATEARNLAKRYNIPVISVTQAADSASGKTVLGRGDVDSSNVGIPGQCDVMIGIGATGEMEERNMRVLSFPKNKLSGKHSQIQITIDPILSRVVE